MPSVIHPRQSVHVPDDGVVLFLVGMRINQIWNVRQWMPVIGAMTGVLRELAEHPELGVLGPSRTYLSGRTLQVQQYWRSLGHLETYARSKEHAHLPAWREFYRRARGTDAVGIFHEAYAVPFRGGDALYVNMPIHGLGAAVSLTAATTPSERAPSAAGSG
jgi:hypothetical protein